LITVTHPLTGVVGYQYDLVGNRTGLVYPHSAGSGQAGRIVTHSYNGNYQLTQLKDLDGNFITYNYDEVGRLITRTLPNGIQTAYDYDDANRLLRLTHQDGSGGLLADFQYEVDAVGNRQVVTETLLSPAVVHTLQTYLEENGLLVLEAENGAAAPGVSGHTWLTQTAQTGYAGNSYTRAMPDTGLLYEDDAIQDAPILS
ncbi:MAG: RHS repeat protein, partial [Gammaproteobacteria bacterium]|nr:RHS repeat protein [Gammaproteobacteria bacterium]